MNELTDAQIGSTWNAGLDNPRDQQVMQFARAIIKADRAQQQADPEKLDLAPTNVPEKEANAQNLTPQGQAGQKPVDAGHFYNLVMHALLDVDASHGGCKARLLDIAEQLEVLMLAAPPPAQEPLTDAQKEARWCNATIERTDMQSVYLRGMSDCEAAHGIHSR